MFKNLALVFSLVFSSFAYGDWSGPVSITQIYPHSTNNDGTIYLKFTKMINPSDCSRPSLIALTSDNKLFSEIYSLLMMAYTTDTKVTYYVEGCDNSSWPKLLHIQTVR